jgi:hypothetical protein
LLFRLWGDAEVSLLGRNLMDTDALGEEIIKLIFLNLKNETDSKLTFKAEAI